MDLHELAKKLNYTNLLKQYRNGKGITYFNKITGRSLRKIVISFRMGYNVVLLRVLSYFKLQFVSVT